MSIHRWVRKYSRLLKPYFDEIKINGKDSQLVADEMMVKINDKWAWLWNVMEKDTRYVLASTISETREMGVAKNLFKEAKSKIDGLPMRITTDGMKAYPRAINSAFYRNSYPRVEHFVAPGITHKHHNNLIERHHNTIRSRTKVMRGFRNMQSAIEIMDIWHMHFNCLRPNIALGNSTPSKSAGIEFRNLMDMIWRAHEWHKQHNKSN